MCEYLTSPSRQRPRSIGKATSFTLNSVAKPGFIRLSSEDDPCCAYVQFVGVDPDPRDTGGGLFDLPIALARSPLGCQQAQCLTSPVNSGSAAFHTAMGFTAEFVADYDGAGESRLKLTRSLALK